MRTSDASIYAVGDAVEVKVRQVATLAPSSRAELPPSSRRCVGPPTADVASCVVDLRHTQDWVLGEHTLIPLAGPANRQGRIAADNIMGK